MIRTSTNNFGRPTMDRKDQTLKLRLNDDMRAWIERCADRQGITMSEFVRQIIRQDMERYQGNC